MTKPTVEVKRFMQWCNGTHGHTMLDHDNGDYVRYSDYSALSAQVQELRDDNAGLLDILASCGLGEDQAKEMLKLKQSLATAREEAIESVAQHFEQRNWMEIAKRVRALKSGGEENAKR